MSGSNYCAVPEDFTGYGPDPEHDIYSGGADERVAHIQQECRDEHARGEHAVEPCGDCPICEPSEAM